MAFNTRGLSWLSQNSAAIVRDFRNTSERLGFKGAVHPDVWEEIEREHIRASSALCHLLSDLERFAKARAFDPYADQDRLPIAEPQYTVMDPKVVEELRAFIVTQKRKAAKKTAGKKTAKAKKRR